MNKTGRKEGPKGKLSQEGPCVHNSSGNVHLHLQENGVKKLDFSLIYFMIVPEFFKWKNVFLLFSELDLPSRYMILQFVKDNSKLHNHLLILVNQASYNNRSPQVSVDATQT